MIFRTVRVSTEVVTEMPRRCSIFI